MDKNSFVQSEKFIHPTNEKEVDRSTFVHLGRPWEASRQFMFVLSTWTRRSGHVHSLRLWLVMPPKINSDAAVFSSDEERLASKQTELSWKKENTRNKERKGCFLPFLHTDERASGGCFPSFQKKEDDFLAIRCKMLPLMILATTVCSWVLLGCYQSRGWPLRSQWRESKQFPVKPRG